ncbi:MBL fold metallo-hydrolase [Lacticaseibacillus baoqingensis]|uniref:MBL fold metallo-hydrolase n=1 Tax=Lacticaseibacillus baoqingensis TaxID=2486013 RepID=A0ABW4E3U3_9LACO|nr:MBL fold metallo-hydrolase [Lacticaseibacillus baoqingensis]
MTSVRFLNGLNTLGGNIVEIATATSRVITDFGLATTAPAAGGSAANPLPNLPELFADTADAFTDEAIVITHWHHGHMDALRYLQKAVPIYLSPASMRLYAALVALGQQKPLANVHPLPLTIPLAIGDLSVTGFASDHDEPGAMAVLIDDGDHAYLTSGDVRLNDAHQTAVAKWCQAVKKRHVKMLFLDCTAFANEMPPAGAAPTLLNEADLQAAIADCLAASSQLVAVDCDQRNWQRLAALQTTAHRHHRQVAWPPATAQLLAQVAHITPDGPIRLAQLRAQPNRYVVATTPATVGALADLPVDLYCHVTTETAAVFPPLCAKLQPLVRTFAVASHATAPDVIRLCQMVAPDIVVPWHCLAPDRAAAALDAHTKAAVLLPEKELYYTVDAEENGDEPGM